MNDIEQRSPSWFAIRCGKVTASRVNDLMAKTKTGYAASRDNYMAQLVCERITGKPAESYSNAAMQWGTEQEPFARAAYEAHTGVIVEETGFHSHPTIEAAGASPDGLVGEDGLVEIKCPNTATHIDTLLDEFIPIKYFCQMQMQMVCTGRKWCDFVSFDPRMPEGAQLFVQRLHRDENFVKKMEEEISKFLIELDRKTSKINEFIEASK